MALYLDLLADLRQAFAEDLEAPSVLFQRYTRTNDLVTGAVTSNLVLSTYMSGVLVPVSSAAESLDISFMDGVRHDTNVRVGIFVSSDMGPTPPLPGDLADLYSDGRMWTVIGCTPINPNASPMDLLYVVGFKLP